LGPAWRSPFAVQISTSGNSALLIGAGYMIVTSDIGSWSVRSVQISLKARIWT
jgi:hypothetical protein